MSKWSVLTNEEIEKAKINPKLLAMIQSYLDVNHLEKKDIRILDWGSGRGKTVALLRA